MARRKSESAISFFSFQDIIMSVVGIMVLITIILILKLIVQTTLAAAASSVDITELQRQIDSMHPVLQEIQDEIAVLHNLKSEAKIWTPSSDEINAVKTSAEHLEADIAAVETKIKNSQERNENLKRSPNIQQLAETESYVKKLQEEVEKLKQENEKAKAEEDDLLAKVAPLRKRGKDLDIEIAADVSMQLKVNIPVHQDKTAFILLYGNGVIDVLPTDGSARKKFTSRSSLDSWINGRNKAKEYFVIYVRPSSFGEHEKIVSELKRQEFDCGLQVIGENTDFLIQ